MKKPKKIRVQLTKPHTHAGKPHKPGDSIELWPRQVARLRELSAIRGEARDPDGDEE